MIYTVEVWSQNPASFNSDLLSNADIHALIYSDELLTSIVIKSAVCRHHYMVIVLQNDRHYYMIIMLHAG